MTEMNGTQPTNGALEPIAGTVRPTDITQEMQVAYLDYAMSVIVARALPDVRDGLKPVHRRILYAIYHDLSLTYDKPHKKSARIVGEVLGKYHPHGDAAVYDAMVRMAQSFSLRYPLIDGQGNFGSIDGDNAAAMRYTEARLAKISSLMLDDLGKDTVDWHENFDNTLREPDILPAALPNLLINGSSGIAVGMATNIPPHNLGEVVDALVYIIDRFDKVDDVTIEQLMQFIKGPDFPTGGIVYRFREENKNEDDVDAIAQGYSVGKSRLIIQAKAHFEEISRGRTRIVITELPYQTNKTTLLERIADLVRDGKIEGIGDLRDESDRTGMRIVIELARTVDPKDVLADLFKYTPLQQTFGMQMLALVDSHPRLLSLKRLLQLFVQHRQEIVRRRSEYDLKQARDRAHIVEGLLRALDVLDEVIQTIRRSQTVETARKNLISNFKFTEIQAQAILDMQLRRLAALERKKLKDEHDDLLKRITYLEDLLANPHKILIVIREELLALKAEYADARRTQIVDRTRGTLTTTDLLPDQQVWVSVSKNGDLRRQPVVKLSAATVRQVGKDSQVALLSANTRDYLYVFSKDGRCSRIGIHEIPGEGSSKKVSDLSGFLGRDAMAAAVTLPRTALGDDGGYLFLVTEQGAVKRVAVTDVQANTGSEFAVINVDDSDRLGWVLHTTGNQEVILVTASGQSIRFAEADVRSMGLPAGGVGGIRLKKKDQVIYAGIVDPDGELLSVTVEGYGKKTPLTEYSTQGRNGSGIVTHKTSAKTGPVSAALVLSPAAATMLAFVTLRGTAKPVALDELPAMGRGVMGKQLIKTADKDAVAVIWALSDSRDTPEPEPPAGDTSPRRSRAEIPAEQAELLQVPAGSDSRGSQQQAVAEAASSPPAVRASQRNGKQPAAANGSPAPEDKPSAKGRRRQRGPAPPTATDTTMPQASPTPDQAPPGNDGAAAKRRTSTRRRTSQPAPAAPAPPSSRQRARRSQDNQIPEDKPQQAVTPETATAPAGKRAPRAKATSQPTKPNAKEAKGETKAAQKAATSPKTRAKPAPTTKDVSKSPSRRAKTGSATGVAAEAARAAPSKKAAASKPPATQPAPPSAAPAGKAAPSQAPPKERRKAAAAGQDTVARSAPAKPAKAATSKSTDAARASKSKATATKSSKMAQKDGDKTKTAAQAPAQSTSQPPLQPTLVDVAPASTSKRDKTAAQKLQTVVSVPSGQVRSKKQNK